MDIPPVIPVSVPKIRLISTSSYEKRIEDIIALLQEDDQDCYFDDPDDFEAYRLFIGEYLIPEDIISRVKSTKIKKMMIEYNSRFPLEDKCGNWDLPQIILYSLKNGVYRLWLEDTRIGIATNTFNKDITEDDLYEYIEIFHDRFYDCYMNRILPFKGVLPCNFKPAKK